MKNILVLVISLTFFVGLVTYLLKNKDEDVGLQLSLPSSENIGVTMEMSNKESHNIAEDLSTIETNSSEDLGEEATQKRLKLSDELNALLNCQLTDSCPEDNSDPRAASILLGNMLAEKLQQYLDLHLDNNYYDAQSLAMVKQFLNYPDGHVQEKAINLMSAQPADLETGQALINVLEDSFDAKIMNQSLIELQRYPQLGDEIKSLLQSSLVTGSFYVAREIASQIIPFLNEDNINSYIDIANKLPPRSKRARFLKANIKEYQLRQTSG